MNSNVLSRRHLGVAAVSVGLAGLTHNVTGQQKEPAKPLPINTGQYGARHREAVDRILAVLGKGVPLNSEKGLNNVRQLLVDSGLLSQDEASLLGKIISAIFHSSTLSAMQEVVGAIRNELAKFAKDVANSIASIAEDSIEFVRKILSDKDKLKAIAIIAADLGGAITGAYSMIGGGIPLAAIGGLIGAISSSALSASQVF